MRIGYLASHYPAVSHTFVLREIRALRRAGVEVETFSLHRAPPSELLAQADRDEAARTYAVLPPRWFELLRCHAIAFARAPRRYLVTLAFALGRANPGLRGRVWGLFYFGEAMAIWRAARKRGIRHLHAIFADGASDVALLVCHFGGDGWTWSLAVHGPVEFYDVRLNHLSEKLASARFAVAISDFGRSQLMTLVAEERWGDVHLVRCGIDPREFAAGPAPHNRDPHILCVGRLVALKGHPLLVSACAELHARGIPARLTLVGEGPERSRLESLARRHGIGDHVRFTGAVGQDEIRDLYRSADVFCLPSLSEGLPVVLMEAMALGVPVLSTRIMGIPELIEDGRSGLLVSPGRVDQVAAALERLLTDPELRARLAAGAREKVRSEFDVDVWARRLREVLTTTVGTSA